MTATLTPSRASTAADLDTVLSLGSLNPRQPFEQAVERLRAIDAATAVQWLTRHKVVSLVARRMSAVPDGTVPAGFAAQLHRAVKLREQINDSLDGELPNLRRLVERSGVRCFLIKGMAARAAYVRAHDRDIGDFDVWVPEPGEAVRLAGVLAGDGYEVARHEVPWLKQTSHGALYGQILLEKPVGSGGVAVDIHFGGYSVRHCALLRLDPGAAGPGLHILDSAQNLPMVVANAAGDFFATLKDVNDLSLAVGDPDLDWTVVRARLREIGLEAFFNHLLVLLRRWHALDPGRRRTADRQRFRGAWEPAPSPLQPLWNRRWLATTLHAARMGRRTSLAVGWTAMRTAAAYYRHPLSGRLDPTGARPAVRVPQDLAPWNCVRLLPLDAVAELLPGAEPPAEDRQGAAERPAPAVPLIEEPDTDLAVVAGPAGDLVRLNGAIYLPTIWYDLPEHRIRAALAFRQTTGRPQSSSGTHAAFAAIRRHQAAPLALAQRMVGLGAVEVSGAGAEVTLSDGRRVLDFGSYAVTLAGHAHPAVVAAVREQLGALPTATRSLANPVTAAFVDRLVRAVGIDGLGRVWLGLNGADAVEAALKLARASTGRSRILAVKGGFHGKSLGALAATSSDRYRAPVRDLLPGVDHIDPGDRGAVARACAAGDVAGLIFEPVQGEHGVVPLDPGVLRAWAVAAREAGAVVIADEIQSGLGRCGPLSLAHAWKVPIDALLLGKSLGGGVMPLSALVCTDALYRPLSVDPFLHTTTFSGHPLSCAAGLAMLDVVAELGPAAERLSDQVAEALTRLRERHPDLVTEVRGRGLLWGLCFASAAAAGDVLVTVSQRGLLLSPCLGRPEVLRLLPPMVTTAEQLTAAAAVLDEACRQVGEQHRAQKGETT